MCTPQSIIEKLGCLAVDEAVKVATKAGQYVFQYKTNLEKLEAEMTSLKDRMEFNERKVYEANDRGEEVENAVSHWQTKADKLKGDVEQLKEQSTAKENMLCFACSCPNIKWRYRLSKQAEQKILDVQQLVRDSHFNPISHPKPPPPELELLSNDNYVKVDSRTSILNNIVDGLKDPNVKMIGVYGLGGVGKTTLVKEVGQKMQNDGNFKQVSLAVVSKDLNVKDIQSKLADSLNFKLDVGADEKGRAIQLWNKFTNGENYLVILDDIWEPIDIKGIGIPITDGKKGCKVLLTSRKEDLLRNRMKVDRNIPIAELSYPEAWTLFNEKVGNSIKSQPELYSLARKVCEKCKGLPVAINALGAALENQQEHAWNNALDNLERYMLANIEGIDPSVCASLKVSYDMLKSPDAQSCFLLCCLFAEDAEISIEDLMRHCVARSLLRQNPRTFDEATNAVSTVVGTLKSSSLLLNGSNENVVKIHDVIRDVGIWIGREEKTFLVDHGVLQWPRNPINGPSYSAISLRFGKIKVLPEGLTCPQLHTLILDNGELSDLKVPDKFFNGMENLTVLILTRLRMRRLPSSLANLTNLRMLYLNECELEDIAILGDLTRNLEVLSLRGSNIEALPQEIGQLTGLRLLDLQDCDELKVIQEGVISHLKSLEELYIPDAFEAWEASTDKHQDTSISSNVSLDELRWSLSSGQLTTLHIFVPNAMLFPKEGLKFENLKRFKIAVGSRFDHYKEYEIGYSGMRMLKLEQILLRKELMPLVDKAEVLVLCKIEGLKKVLQDSRGGNGLCNWKYLEIESCFDDWECLVPRHGNSFDKLTNLIIMKCNFKYLFSQSTVRRLIHLESLYVESCEIMEEIVRFEGQNDDDEIISEVKFIKLKYLVLKSLPNLISFYAKKEKTGTTMGSSSTRAQPLFNEKVIFPVLENLAIKGVSNIIEIWDKQSIGVLQERGSFCQLVVVDVDNCERLIHVFPSNMHPLLKNLNSLYVKRCGSMEGIIVGFEGEQDEDGLENGVTFGKLSYLTLRELPNLVSFCTKLGKEGTTERSSSTNTAQPLFNEKVIFPVLENLTIQGVSNIIDIWNKQSIGALQERGSFCQLVVVGVHNCERLMHVFPSNMHPLLKSLNNLYISGCGSMEGIIVGFEGEQDEDGLKNGVTFSKLSYLTLWELPNLISFFTKLGKEGTTERSSSTNTARPLFNEKVAFPALEYLTIQDLPNIIEIWDKQPLSEPEKEIESFRKLEYFSLRGCKQLVYVFSSYMLPQLQNLKVLEIGNCKKLEVVFSRELKEKEGASNGIIVFPQLCNVKLQSLDNIKSFCSGTQVFLSNKVAFPALTWLTIQDAPNIIEIWDKQPVLEQEKETESFRNLEVFSVVGCKQLVYVFPSYMLPQLQNLEWLEIINCKEVEVIVSGELKETKAANNNITVFPQLKRVELRSLDNIRSFCSGMQVFLSNKDAFPVLEEIIIDENLEYFRSGTSTKKVAIEECGTSGKENDHNVEEG